MRTKVFLAAALAVAAFSALPTVAAAEPAQLRNIFGNDPSSIKLSSENLKFWGNLGTEVACEDNSISATRRGTGRYTVSSSQFQDGVLGTHNCPVLGTKGRVTARIRPVTFREDIQFIKAEGTEVITAHTRVDFEILFIDPNLNPTPPHGFRECKYEASVEGRVFGDEIEIHSVVPVLVTGGDRFNNGCAIQGILSGTFRMSDREDNPVTAM